MKNIANTMKYFTNTQSVFDCHLKRIFVRLGQLITTDKLVVVGDKNTI